MKWSDLSGKKLSALSHPSDITEMLNKEAATLGIKGERYYLHSEQRDKTIISNASPSIYEKLKPSKYVAPSLVGSNLESLLSCLKARIDILHNDLPGGENGFSDGKAFQLNHCYHNSKVIFSLIKHLANTSKISQEHSSQIVLGYCVRKIPFGTQVGDIVIENDSILLHDWHIWNYFNKILVDMSLFNNGGLLPPDGSVSSWGTAEDHIFIYPPKGMEYWGVAFEKPEKFDEAISQYTGFQQ